MFKSLKIEILKNHFFEIKQDFNFIFFLNNVLKKDNELSNFDNYFIIIEKKIIKIGIKCNNLHKINFTYKYLYKHLYNNNINFNSDKMIILEYNNFNNNIFFFN